MTNFFKISLKSKMRCAEINKNIPGADKSLQIFLSSDNLLTANNQHNDRRHHIPAKTSYRIDRYITRCSDDHYGHRSYPGFLSWLSGTNRFVRNNAHFIFHKVDHPFLRTNFRVPERSVSVSCGDEKDRKSTGFIPYQTRFLAAVC